MSKNSKNIISKEELEDLFVKQNLTRNQIAEKIGIKPDAVKYLIKINGITKPDSLRVKNIAKTKLERYGDPYFYDKEKAKKTMLKKYGVEHALQSKDIINKIKQTTLERYGDENYRNINKIKQTKLNKFGDENYSNRELAKQTTLERYGVEYYSQTLECKNKVKQSKLEKYGDENYINKDKIKQTNVEKYGVEYPQILNEIKEKSKQTNLNKYGVEYYTQTDEYKEKAKQTSLKKYGVEHYCQSSEYKEKAKNTSNKKYNRDYYQKSLIPLNILNIIDNKDNLIEYIKNNAITDIVMLKQFLGISYKTLQRRINKWNLYDLFDKKIYSNSEKELKDFISQYYIIESNKRLLDGKEIDIFIPEKNIGIEFNGNYWHSSLYKEKKYHYNKMMLAKEKGIDLIQIWEDQWRYKQDIVKDILLSRLGLISDKIYARKCVIKEVSLDEYRMFCDLYHIQGYKPAKYVYGLYYNNELVQLASFEKCRKYGNRGVQAEWEYVRGVIKSKISVVGGTSKLLNYFVKQHKPESILCYADANLFNGKGYIKSGFTFISMTGPDLFFTVTKDGSRKMRNPYRYKEDMQLVSENKIYPCYGCGSYKFIWRNIDIL